MKYPIYFGQEIRKLRREKELTQRELSKKLHCDYKTVNYMENNKHVIRVKHLVDICNTFDVNMDCFVSKALITLRDFLPPQDEMDKYPVFVKRKAVHPDEFSQKFEDISHIIYRLEKFNAGRFELFYQVIKGCDREKEVE